jgi:hypothetical protein
MNVCVKELWSLAKMFVGEPGQRSLQIQLALELHVLGVEVLRHSQVIEHRDELDPLVFQRDRVGAREQEDYRGEPVSLRQQVHLRSFHILLSVAAESGLPPQIGGEALLIEIQTRDIVDRDRVQTGL